MILAEIQPAEADGKDQHQSAEKRSRAADKLSGAITVHQTEHDVLLFHILLYLTVISRCNCCISLKVHFVLLLDFLMGRQ